MSTFEAEPINVYTITYQYDKLKVPSVIQNCIDITIHADVVEFQPLTAAPESQHSWPIWERIGERVYLENGKLVKVEAGNLKRYTVTRRT